MPDLSNNANINHVDLDALFGTDTEEGRQQFKTFFREFHTDLHNCLYDEFLIAGGYPPRAPHRQQSKQDQQSKQGQQSEPGQQSQQSKTGQQGSTGASGAEDKSTAEKKT